MQIDEGLCFGREMRQAGEGRVHARCATGNTRRCNRVSSLQLTLGHHRQCDAAQSQPGIAKKLTTCLLDLKFAKRIHRNTDRLVAVKCFVEVQHEVGEHRPGGGFTHRCRANRSRFATVDQLGCILQTRGIVSSLLLDRLLQEFQLGVIGATRHDRLKHPSDPFLIVARCRKRTFGESSGRFDMLNIVQQLQRLQRCIAAFTSRAGLLAIGSVEVREEGWWAVRLMKQ